MYDPTKPYRHLILDLIRSTWSSPFVSVQDGVYPILERRVAFPEVDHTDGIGTKGEYHWREGTFAAAALDSLAMNLNDLAMVGARAYKLQNHIVLPTDDRNAILDIVTTLAKECRARQIVMTGGETSIHEGAPGLDVSITISGFVERPRENTFAPGDVLFGLRSNGIHANGFTKVREVFGDEIRPEFTLPTAMYADAVLEILSEHDVHGMMHITGGGYTKFKDWISGVDLHFIRLTKDPPHDIFFDLYRRHVSDLDMYRTFNCGIGFVLSVPNSSVGSLIRAYDLVVVGEVSAGSGRIIIDSAFSSTTVSL